MEIQLENPPILLSKKLLSLKGTTCHYILITTQLLSVTADNAPRVHHHYKSHKMALWLELIPRIHKPDIFNPLLHLLDDYQNRSSFEEEGTRDIDLSELFATRSSTTQSTTIGTTVHLTDLPSTTETSATFFQTSSSSFSSSSSGSSATRRDSYHRRQTSPRDIASTASLLDYDLVTVVAADAAAAAPSEATGSSTLGVTIAVGCALLALNSLVFAATFCQWHRLGRTLQARQDEMGKDLTGGYAVDVRMSHYDDPHPVLNDRCLTIPGSGCYDPNSVRLPPGCLEGTGKKQSTPQGSPTLSCALLGNSVRSPARIQRQEALMLNRRNSPNDLSETQRTTLSQKYSTTVV